MKIVVLDGYALNPGDLSWSGIEELGDCTLYERTFADQTLERAAGADVLITNKTLLPAEIINQLPELKYIGILATGYNVVDIEAAKRRGIVVTNIPAYSTASVAQMAIALLLTIVHRVEYYTEQNRHGRWSANVDFCYTDFPLMELADKQFGVVGFGHTGAATARIAQALGMRVKVFTSKPAEALPEGMEKMGMEELFETSDVLSLHCPLNEDTFHLVNAERLSRMKPTAILLNTGRGPLIDEQALADALNSGKIQAAGVDVLSVEPPSADNPLLSADHCFVTPHIAWATAEARQRLMHIAVENLKAFLAGTPVNNVAR
jgi:glycerate dehydrogenase